MTKATGALYLNAHLEKVMGALPQPPTPIPPTTTSTAPEAMGAGLEAIVEVGDDSRKRPAP